MDTKSWTGWAVCVGLAILNGFLGASPGDPYLAAALVIVALGGPGFYKKGEENA